MGKVRRKPGSRKLSCDVPLSKTVTQGVETLVLSAFLRGREKRSIRAIRTPPKSRIKNEKVWRE